MAFGIYFSFFQVLTVAGRQRENDITKGSEESGKGKNEDLIVSCLSPTSAQSETSGLSSPRLGVN